jgi:dihydrofolate synthase / folylpolyglutamate synthase
MPARSLQDWLALQHSTHPSNIDLGLERVRSVAQRLALLPFMMQVITVAGTNGKGSTVAHLEALLGAAGQRCGTFTSPHLLRYNERVRVAGAEASDAEFISAFEAIDQARGATTLTYFEYGALAALLIFRARDVRVAVLEVGLGGRLDAVNIVDADVAIITSIAFDHREWLGDTLEQIGFEKAGILRAGRPAVLAAPDLPQSIFAHARAIGARTCVASRDYRWHIEAGAAGRWQYAGIALRFDSLPPPALAGEQQYANAAAAIAALEVLPLRPALSRTLVTHALSAVTLQGRFQRLDPAQHGGVEWILDVAHNEAAAQRLARNLAALPRATKTIAVVAILGDKDVAAIVRTLAGLVDVWIACSIDEPRGLPASELVQRSAVLGTTALQAASVAAGLAAARGLARHGDRVVVFGSFLTVGPALQASGLY